jgi:hypothetical protein
MSSTYLYFEYVVLFICVLSYLTFFSASYKIKDSWNDYQNKDITLSMIFLGILICGELVCSFLDMYSQCKTGIPGMTVLYVILVWVLLMGGIQLFMLSNPGIKSAFSDVIGYAIIYSKSNKILSKLLTPPSKSENKHNSDIYLSEIIGDKGLFINSMVPGNFEKLWKTLDGRSDPNLYDNPDIKQELLNCVVIRDRIGECCWYVWTGVLCISILSLHASTINCSLSQAEVQQNASTYTATDINPNAEVYVAD